MVRGAVVVRHFVSELQLRLGQRRLLQSLLQLNSPARIFLDNVVFRVLLEGSGAQALLFAFVGEHASIILEGGRNVGVVRPFAPLHR